MARSDDARADPHLPPLFSGLRCPAGQDAFTFAKERAVAGTEAGLLVHDITPDHLSAALVLAPEVSLPEACAMILVAGVGFADAFGALAPSEIAAQLEWPGGFRIDGARCGGLRVAADRCDDTAVPGWLVIGIDVPFASRSDADPGATPDLTTIRDEGCASIQPKDLLESWARHTLVWLHHWTEEGLGRVHAEWTGRAFGLGTAVEVLLPDGSRRGEFIGLDEKGGMLLKSGGTTELLPLTMALDLS